MKTKIKFGTMVACIALFSNVVSAQIPDTTDISRRRVVPVPAPDPDTLDVLKKQTPVPDTVRVVKETTQVVHDTVVKPNQHTELPALKRGELGIRYMPTFASLALRNSNNETIQGDVTMSNGFGVMLAGNFSKNVGIQAEVDYLNITQKYKDINLSRQVNVNYLNIPILLSINTNKRRMVNWNFVAGPQFGINVGSNIKTTGNDNTGTLNAVVGASGTDVGLAYGTGLEFALGKSHCARLDLGYRGFYGLINANANQVSTNPNTYNVLVNASRKTNGAYIGLTWCF